MGLQLPSELVSILGMLGYNWPEADEEKLFDMGQTWIGFSGTLSGTVSAAARHGESVWENNTGKAVDAFRERWTGEQSPVTFLDRGAIAATGVGVGMMIAAAV